MSVRITREERESGIVWNEADDTALLWTLSEPIKRRMLRRFGPATSTHGSCQEWEIPKSCVKLPGKPRVMSEANRARLAEAGRKLAGR